MDSSKFFNRKINEIENCYRILRCAVFGASRRPHVRVRQRPASATGYGGVNSDRRPHVRVCQWPASATGYGGVSPPPFYSIKLRARCKIMEIPPKAAFISSATYSERRPPARPPQACTHTHRSPVPIR
jgi:hypothetical protein